MQVSSKVIILFFFLIKNKFPHVYFKFISLCVFWFWFLLDAFTAIANILPKGFYEYYYA